MKRSSSQHVLPLLSLFAVLLAVATLLPTALRPPAPPAADSAEFNPDAPPDDDEQAIISQLNRGASATAGSGPVVDGDGPGEAVASAPRGARACPGGFGDPPRQVESVYSAPCSPAFVGDNGGATHRGVTANELRLAVVYRGGDSGMDEGPIPEQAPDGEDDQNRTLRVFQAYFNRNFQLYGRKLRLYAVSISTNVENQAAGARRAADEYKVFGSVQLGGASVPYNNEANRLGLVTFGSTEYADDWYAERAPLAYNWRFGSTTAFALGAEYICKKLAGKPARFGGPDVESTRRRFGMIFYAETGAGTYEYNGDTMDGLLRDGCGERLAAVVKYDLRDTSTVGQDIATSIAKMREAGVTTIVYAGATIQAPQFAAQADQLGYYPEWWLAGIDEVEDNSLGRRAPATQWTHAFGLNLDELPRPEGSDDAWRAYRTIDPDGVPDSATQPAFYSLLQIMNGAQSAGPKLTPQTFARGLHALGKRRPDPVWSVGGGYAPGDQTYGDYAAEMWWDPVAADPVTGQPGAYRYVGGGRRFTFGEVTRQPSRMFADGVTGGW